MLVISSLSTNALATCFPEGKYLNLVKSSADVLLQHARDVYGPTQTPLFIDTINPHTYEPYVWEIDPNEEVVARFGQPSKQIMANFLFMQNILVTLNELSKLTGNSHYRNEAVRCGAYALNHLCDEHGLIHCGKHATYDALSDRKLGHNGKPHFFYFNTGCFGAWPFLYEIDPLRVNRHIEQVWNVTLNQPDYWKRLEWNLHPVYGKPPYRIPWDRVQLIEEDVKVPFKTQKAVVYPQMTADLMYSALVYSQQRGNDQRAWQAGRTILKRFIDARDSKTGLSPSSYAYHARHTSWAEYSGATKARDLLGVPFFIKLAETADHEHDGALIRQFAIDEVKTLIKYKLIPGTNRYYPTVKFDGTPLGKPQIIDEGLIWSIAKAYRMSGDAKIFNALRSIMKAFDYGDIGTTAGKDVNLNHHSDIDIDIYPDKDQNIKAGFLVHVFAELYRKANELQGKPEAIPYLEFGAKLADKVVEKTYVNGLFARRTNAKWARTASMIPMALLDLEAAAKGLELNSESVFVRYYVYRFTRKHDRKPNDNYHDWAIYNAIVERKNR